MNWETLLKPVRFGDENQTKLLNDSTRTNFQRDYDRIIFSSPFRRLQNKTQVFPLPERIFVHNRLTHSIEVASVGRSLGYYSIKTIQEKEKNISLNLVQEIPTIISAACLAHDLGNPPFGHSGEESIRRYFQDNANLIKPLVSEHEWNDLIRYEGNANALRLLTTQFNGKREGGFRLSYVVLASMVKYPYPSSFQSKKFGYFKSEAETVSLIAKALKINCINADTGVFSRHPLVYLVEAADDICYQIMDLEDAYKLGILNHELITNLFINFFDDIDNKKELIKIKKTLREVTDKNEQISFLRAIVIGKLISECSEVFFNNYDLIMAGEKVSPLIDQIKEPSLSAMNRIKDFAIEEVYNHKTVIEIEIGGNKVLYSLLDNYIPALLNPANSHSKKTLRLIPRQYNISEGSYYQKIMSLLDYISGMTDLYALEQYRTFQGISIPGIQG